MKREKRALLVVVAVAAGVVMLTACTPKYRDFNRTEVVKDGVTNTVTNVREGEGWNSAPTAGGLVPGVTDQRNSGYGYPYAYPPHGGRYGYPVDPGYPRRPGWYIGGGISGGR